MAAGEGQLQRIIRDLQDAVAELSKEYRESGEPITDDSSNLHKFSYKLEYLLQFDQKEKTTFLGTRKDYWDYFSDCLAKIKGANDGIRFVKSIPELKTSLGKGRAFIRYSLVHQRLADTLQQCLINHRVTSDWYYARSPLLKPHLSVDIIGHLYELNEVQFDVASRGHDLDSAWPTFARRSLGPGSPGHLWKPPSRSSSINSLASTFSQAQEFPCSPDFGLLDESGELCEPADASGGGAGGGAGAVEALRLELDQAELQQRELLERLQQMGGEGAELRRVTEQLQAQLDVSLTSQEAERRDSARQRQQLEERAESQAREAESLRAESRAKEAESRDLRAKLEGAEQRNSELLSRLQGELSEKGQQTASYFDSAQKIHELLDQLKEVEREKQEAQREVEEQRAELSRAESALVESEARLVALTISAGADSARVQELRASLEQQQGALSQREKEASRLQTRLQEARGSLEARDRQAEEEKEELRRLHAGQKEALESRARDLEERLRAGEEELVASEERARGLEQEAQARAGLEAELREQAKKLEEYKVQCGSLMELNGSLLQTVKRNEEAARGLAEERAGLRARLEGAAATGEERERRLERENRELREEQAAVKEALASMQAELRSIGAQISELEGSLAASRRREAELQDQLRERERERAELQEQERERAELLEQERGKWEKERVEWNKERVELQKQEKERAELQEQERAEWEKERVELQKQERAEWEKERVELQKQRAEWEKERAELQKQERAEWEKERAELQKQERVEWEKERAELQKQERAEWEKERTELQKQERAEWEKERAELQKQERAEWEKERAELQKQERAEWEKERAELQEREHEAGARLSRAEAQLELHLGEVSRLQEEVLGLRTELRRASEEEARARSRLEAAEAERDELRSLGESLKAQLEQMNRGHVQELQTCRQEVEALRAETEREASEELAGLKEQQEALAGELADAREGLHRANTETAELGVAVCALTAEREEAQRELAGARSGLEEAQAELQDLRDQLERAEGRARNLQESHGEEVAAARFQMSSEAISYQNQIKSASEEAVTLRGQLTAEQEKVRHLEARLSELEAASRKNSLMVDEKDSAISERDAAIGQKDEELQRLRESLERTEADLLSAQSRCQELKGELEVAVAERESHALKMGAELDDLSRTKSTLEERLIELIRDKDELWQKSDALEFEQKLRAEEQWWLVDKEATHCLRCRSQFTWLLRKHHCRLCGHIFCYYCSNNFVMTKLGGKKERCCGDCYSQHSAVTERLTQAELGHTAPPPGPGSAPGPAPYTPMPRVTVTDPAPRPDDAVYDIITEEEVNGVYDSDSLSQATGESPERETETSSPQASAELDSSTSRGDGSTEDPEEQTPTVQDAEIYLLKSGELTQSVSLTAEEMVRFGDGSRELFIKSSCYSVVAMELQTAGPTISWVFSSEPKSISFSVVYREGAQTPLEQATVLIPLTRCDAHRETIQGQLKARNPGTYLLIFDNSYSRFISKKVFYHLTIEKPIIYDGSDCP
ncbi:FYVE and coiled-coil domain-containing protein 1 isoform X2 [Anguilla anguilla]|uniref:FYVE and coiled-coil domain-containing protein 1 isoform X2 n=1 Tax=Anguilla anguilla TaxID=7936 RepID=UPI0015B34E35|nr:FYVE and coiled-coil domain-containing protein 1 isoform X2 [Anguilla anguilla]